VLTNQIGSLGAQQGISQVIVSIRFEILHFVQNDCENKCHLHLNKALALSWGSE